ncbi:hypothetical protein IMCC20628_00493 [Hoeflea sp. IMCC20628]|nr:hypothetical protein IMCC20628_00493 [Hoeflea sp. IMCC20628]
MRACQTEMGAKKIIDPMFDPSAKPTLVRNAANYRSPPFVDLWLAEASAGS